MCALFDVVRLVGVDEPQTDMAEVAETKGPRCRLAEERDVRAVFVKLDAVVVAGAFESISAISRMASARSSR
jgi:hypothetical protein